MRWEGHTDMMDPSNSIIPPIPMVWSNLPTYINRDGQRQVVRGQTEPIGSSLAHFIKMIWDGRHRANKSGHGFTSSICAKCDPAKCGNFIADGARCGYDEAQRQRGPVLCNPRHRRWKRLARGFQMIGFDIEVAEGADDPDAGEREVRDLLAHTLVNKACFPGYAAIIYTSPSNGKIKGDYPHPRCRWRLLFPLDQPIKSTTAAEDYAAIWLAMRSKIQTDHVDEGAKDVTRIWYTPCHRDESPAQLYVRHGALLQASTLQKLAAAKQQTDQATRDVRRIRTSKIDVGSGAPLAAKIAAKIIDDIRNAPPNERHDMIRRKVHKLAGICRQEGLASGRWLDLAIDAAVDRAETPEKKKDSERTAKDAWDHGWAAPMAAAEAFSNFQAGGQP